MPAQNIDNINDLQEQVLDKQDTLLSKKEVKTLSNISAPTYENMKDDIANHEVNRKGKNITVKELVSSIWSDGKVRLEKGEKWDYIKRWSELWAWVQIFLISQWYDVVKNNKLSWSVDGKLGRFTHKAISMYRNDNKLQWQIDENRNVIHKNQDKIDKKVLSDINQRLQWATEYSKDWKNPIKVRIIDKNKPFVVAVENYWKSTTVDLEKWTFTFDGKVFPWFTRKKMDKVWGKINIAPTSDENQILLEHVYKQAWFLNYVFWKFVNLREKGEGIKRISPSYWKMNRESARSENPFYVNGNLINFDNGVVFDTRVISSRANRKWTKYDRLWEDWNGMWIQDPNQIVDILNVLFKKYKI